METITFQISVDCMVVMQESKTSQNLLGIARYYWLSERTVLVQQVSN